MPTLLISGAAGYIGRQLTAALEAEFELRLGDVVPLEDPRYLPLDTTDPGQTAAAVDGVDAVIHLAIAGGHEGAYEDEAFNQRRFDVNVRGTHNLAQAAGRAGVKRFVQTSSIMVTWGYRPPRWIPADALPCPVGTYALTKQLAEEVCRHAARGHRMSTLCLRIAKPIALDDPFWKSRPIRPQFVPFPDLIQAYRLAVTAAEIDFEIVTIVGDSDRRRWDLSKAERLLGYRPQIRWEETEYEIGTEDEPLE